MTATLLMLLKFHGFLFSGGISTHPTTVFESLEYVILQMKWEDWKYEGKSVLSGINDVGFLWAELDLSEIKLDDYSKDMIIRSKC